MQSIADAQSRMGLGARQVQGPVGPVHGVGVAVSREPVAAKRCCQREREIGVGVADRPAERCMEVVDLGVHPGEVLPGVDAPQCPFGSVALREREVVAIVALAHRQTIGGGGKVLAGVGADRFEHPQPAWARMRADVA